MYVTNTSLCTTPGCLDAASTIISNLHPDYGSIDPCEDFDLYVCGGYPDRDLGVDNPDVLSADIQNQNDLILSVALTTPPGPEADPEDAALFNKMSVDYQTCLDSSKIAANGTPGLPTIIARVVELFPVDYVSNTTLSEQDYDSLASAITYLASSGISTFGDFWVYQDVKGDPTHNIPFFGLVDISRLDQPAAEPMNAGIYSTLLNMTLVEGTDTFAEQLASFLPKSAQEAAPSLVQNLIKFATPLAELETLISSQLKYSTTDYPYQGMFDQSTLSEASKASPALVLDKVINSIVPEDYVVDRIALPYKTVYPRMSEIISKQTPATIQAFMIARALISYSAQTSAGLVGAGPDRSEVCQEYIRSSLTWISSRFWLKRRYSEHTQNLVLNLSEEIRQTFMHRVDGQDWIANEDMPLIKNKIQDMRLNIGYPELPDVMNATALLDCYSGINITDSFFDNVKSIRQWNFNNTFTSLTAPIDRREFLLYGVASWTANSRAWREHNAAHVTSGAIQAPWFHANATRYLTFGTIGYLTAHEMMHNLDSFGTQLSNKRAYRSWLSNSTKKAFDERNQCVVDQYSAIPVRLADGTVLRQANHTVIKVGGALTVTENVADLGGINVAYDAWQSTRADHAEEESRRLPGLEQFSPEQLFFLQFGSNWCSAFDAAKTNETLAIDVHSPNMARIKGAVANSQGFRDAFKCKKRKPDCEMW
ncbi:Metalloprotease [Astrocystis sublimbata]|nr:Metalloprotease [Astrocystis sublimbata]